MRTNDKSEVPLCVQNLKRALPRVAVKDSRRRQGRAARKNQILVEGYGPKLCVNKNGVVDTKTRPNSIMEMKGVCEI